MGTVPLVLIVHGDPRSLPQLWNYRWNLAYYAALGYGVVCGFHGSTSYGQVCGLHPQRLGRTAL